MVIGKPFKFVPVSLLYVIYRGINYLTMIALGLRMANINNPLSTLLHRVVTSRTVLASPLGIAGLLVLTLAVYDAVKFALSSSLVIRMRMATHSTKYNITGTITPDSTRQEVHDAIHGTNKSGRPISP